MSDRLTVNTVQLSWNAEKLRVTKDECVNCRIIIDDCIWGAIT